MNAHKRHLKSLGFALLLLSDIALADIFVITHPQSELNELSKKECIDIFMGRARRLPNGDKFEAIDQAKGSDIRNNFYTKLTGKSVSYINAYWARLFYTGRVQPPADNFKNSQEIIKEVTENPSAIAYISKEDLSSKVKVVYTIKN
ncbi:hypothetical protein [Agaribacterium sp. ZY112]|uniref:hypothetical protein n=1 Tax=Agaribacterium sp. ZY112 TaxID=3233574 RepID=UPI0035253989